MLSKSLFYPVLLSILLMTLWPSLSQAANPAQPVLDTALLCAMNDDACEDADGDGECDPADPSKE